MNGADVSRKVDSELFAGLIERDTTKVADALARGADPNARIENDGTPLHIAVIAGGVENVQALIQAGAKLEASDDLGRTPLHFAAFASDVNTIDALLAAGASIDAKDHNGMTPLDSAAAMSNARNAEALLRAGGHCDKSNLKWTRKRIAERLKSGGKDRS